MINHERCRFGFLAHLLGRPRPTRQTRRRGGGRARTRRRAADLRRVRAASLSTANRRGKSAACANARTNPLGSAPVLLTFGSATSRCGDRGGDHVRTRDLGNRLRIYGGKSNRYMEDIAASGYPPYPPAFMGCGAIGTHEFSGVRSRCAVASPGDYGQEGGKLVANKPSRPGVSVSEGRTFAHPRFVGGLTTRKWDRVWTVSAKNSHALNVAPLISFGDTAVCR